MLQEYYYVKYCDGDIPIGFDSEDYPLEVHTDEIHAFEYCQYVGRDNLAYKYVRNGQRIEKEVYNTTNCTNHRISVSTEHSITEPCQNKIDFTTITIGIASTKSPSYAPTFPTSSPTRKSKKLCGTNKWCIEVDLYPILGSISSEMVEIAYQIDGNDTEFQIQFTSKYRDCVTPTISVSFDKIDHSSEYKDFEIFDNAHQLIYKCNSSQDATCGDSIQCLDNYPLGVAKIAGGSTYNLTIETNGLSEGCGLWTPSHSANISLSITCYLESAQPTTGPTPKPTDQPTRDIYYEAQPVYCGDTIEDVAWYYEDYFEYYLVNNISNGSHVLVDMCYPETEANFAIVIEDDDDYIGSSPPNCSVEFVKQYPSNQIWITLWAEDVPDNRIQTFKMTVFCYTLNPTTSPTVPSIEPSTAPTTAPSVPSMAPTTTPSVPSAAPTGNPLVFPTDSPTKSPSPSPSDSPTVPPKNAPTMPPTRSPSRFPTNAGSYDSYFDIEYRMASIAEVYNDYMETNTLQFLKDITEIIERAHATQNTRGHIQYQHFWVNILTINDKSISELGKLWFKYQGDLVLVFGAKIECSSQICKQLTADISHTTLNMYMSKAINDYLVSRTANPMRK